MKKGKYICPFSDEVKKCLLKRELGCEDCKFFKKQKTLVGFIEK
ncbi:MAG: hypothetical protein QXG39_08975 [Candidatus Aenigmatarchaeota archaeon]